MPKIVSGLGVSGADVPGARVGVVLPAVLLLVTVPLVGFVAKWIHQSRQGLRFDISRRSCT